MYSVKGLGQSYTGDDVTVFSGANDVTVFSGADDVTVFSGFGVVDSYEASMEVIGELQCAISQQGFDPGPLDGLWGTKTQKGLKAYAKSIGQATAMSAPTLAALGLDLTEVQAAKDYQTAHKGERPAAYIPSAVTRCGGVFDVPGAAAAGGFMKRNWKWLTAAGVLTAGAIGVGAWLALRNKDEEEALSGIIAGSPQSYLYGNQYLQQTYGLGRARSGRASGTVMPRYAKRGMGRAPRRPRSRRGMGLVTTDSVFTYENPWLQQIYG